MAESYFVFTYRLEIGGTKNHEYGFHTDSLEDAMKHVANCLGKSESTQSAVITKFIS
jgi:hypothetical protein